MSWLLTLLLDVLYSYFEHVIYQWLKRHGCAYLFHEMLCMITIVFCNNNQRYRSPAEKSPSSKLALLVFVPSRSYHAFLGIILVLELQSSNSCSKQCVKTRGDKVRIKSKAAISLTLSLHCQAIAAMFWIPYSHPIHRHYQF